MLLMLKEFFLSFTINYWLISGDSGKLIYRVKLYRNVTLTTIDNSAFTNFTMRDEVCTSIRSNMMQGTVSILLCPINTH